MSSLLSTFTEIAQIDSRTRSGTIVIPLTTEIPNRVFTVKDTYGASENSTITLITQGGDLFENGLNTMVISNNFGAVTLHSGIANRWATISGSIQNAINVNSLTASTIFLQPGYNSPQKWSFTATHNSFGLQNVSTATNVFTVDISSITRFNGPLIASTITLSSFTLYDRGSLQMKNLQLSSAYLLINGENMSSIASGVGGGGGGGDLTSLNLQSTVQGLGQSYISTLSLTSTVQGLGQSYISTLSLTSTVQGLGQSYISTLSLTSTVQGLGQSYISTLSLTSTVQGLGQSYISTQSLTSTIQGLGQSYISTQSLTSTVQGLGQSYVSTVSLQSTVQGLGLSKTSGTLGVNTTTPYAGYTMDINGPTQSAIYYSTITIGGTTTIVPANFGTFYNITTSGTYTLEFSASQPSSNIGKYNCFRNNCGTTLPLTLTGVSGIASPVILSNAQSATFVVATINTYALF